MRDHGAPPVFPVGISHREQEDARQENHPDRGPRWLDGQVESEGKRVQPGPKEGKAGREKHEGKEDRDQYRPGGEVQAQ